MVRWIAAVAFAVLLLGAAAAPGQAAEKRVALVIGNAAYTTVPRLSNAQNDARAIAQALKSLDFQTVEVALNQPINRLRDTVQRFQRQVGTADVALVFYAGHGVEVGGRNYLVPVDAQLKSDMDVAFEAIPLDLVMQAVEPAKSLRIIILDACRDNPFLNRMAISQGANRGIGRGLARVDPSGDTLVAYAAKAGSTALDGTSANSPFTTALLKHLPTPGLDIRLMFGRVRDTVLELTNRQQEPFVYGSIGGREVYLKPGAAPPAAPALATANSSQAQTEIAYWETVRNAATAAPLQSYLDRYPNGAFAGLARARIQELGREPSASQQLALQTRSAPATQQPTDRRFFRATSREPLRIAVVGPMSGADAALGARLRNGAEQALADINGAGGILGRQAVLAVADDFSNPRMVAAVANKLAADGIQFVIGPIHQDLTMAASEVLHGRGVVQISPSSRSPEYTERGFWNVFRTSGRDDAQGAVAAAYIAAHFKNKRIALVHDRTAYGKALVDEVRKGIAGASLREVLNDGVSVGEKDFSALIAAIKGAGPDVVYWGGQHGEGALLVRQMRERGVKLPIVAGDGITADEFASVGGPGIEGTMITQERDLQNSPDARVVVQKLRARRIEPEAVTLNTYAAVQVIKQAAEAAKSLEPRVVADRMRSGMKFKTVLGEIAFDPKGDMTRPSYAMHVWKKDASGKLTYTEVK